MHPDRLYYSELPADRPPEPGLEQPGQGRDLPLAVALKKAVTVPVLAACRLDAALGRNCCRKAR